MSPGVAVTVSITHRFGCKVQIYYTLQRLISTEQSSYVSAVQATEVVASLPFNQVIPHLAAFPDTLEESLEVLKTSGDTAYYHLQAAQQPHEIYEGILGLMKIFEDACRLQIHLPPEQLDTVLVNKIVYGTHREVRVGSILHLLMFDINLWLCSAFQRLQMWDFVTVRASMAMEIAGMHGEHCYIPRETEHYLRVIRDHPR